MRTADVVEGRARADEIASAMRSFYIQPGPLLRVARTLGTEPRLLARAAAALVPAFLGPHDIGDSRVEENRLA